MHGVDRPGSGRRKAEPASERSNGGQVLDGVERHNGKPTEALGRKQDIERAHESVAKIPDLHSSVATTGEVAKPPAGTIEVSRPTGVDEASDSATLV